MEVILGSGIDVIALGGNAIIPVGGKGTIEEQRGLTADSMVQVAGLISQGRKAIITHGNGPIVGNILERNEAVKDRIPPMPLDVCGADSQGGIGYMIQQCLQNALSARGLDAKCVSLVSQVIVSEGDKAFDNPTKPIGPFYSKGDAERMQRQKGWTVIEDSERGYRRVVPSPRPLEIVESKVISNLLDNGFVVIAVGGGGIPVVERDSNLVGVEAVIDKDRAAAILGAEVDAEKLIILTDVQEVYVNYGKPDQQPIGNISLSDIESLHESGHFPSGSMGPKIESAISFLRSGGEEVIISHARKLIDACQGKAGTHIVKD
jgi:carbamate kinase